MINEIGLLSSNNRTAYHDSVYKMFYKTCTEEEQRDIRIVLDRGNSNTLKIMLTDETDPRFMFALYLTQEDYQVLQTQQGLLVPFETFPKQLVRLLDQCSRGEMFIKITQSSGNEWSMQFIERNEFKHLVHLQLLLSQASDSDLLKYMSSKIKTLMEKLSQANKSLAAKDESMRNLMDQRDAEIRKISLSLESAKDELKRREFEFQRMLTNNTDQISKEKTEWQRDLESKFESKLANLQTELHNKNYDLENLKSELRTKNEKIHSMENLNREHLSTIKSLENELSTSRIETNVLRADLSRSQRECTERDTQLHSLRNRLAESERRLVLKDEQLGKANYSLTQSQQNVAEAESKVTECMKKLYSKEEGLRITTQELCKANEIIAKLTEEVSLLKEKVKFRTEIAFEQEKVITRHQGEVKELEMQREEYKNKLEAVKAEVDSLTKELEATKEKCNEKDKTLEHNSTMIKWLQKRLEDSKTTHSEPYSVHRLTHPTGMTPLHSALSSHASLPSRYVPVGSSVVSNLSPQTEYDPNRFKNTFQSTNKAVSTGISAEYLMPTGTKERNTNSENKDPSSKTVKENALKTHNRKNPKAAIKAPSAYFPFH